MKGAWSPNVAAAMSISDYSVTMRNAHKDVTASINIFPNIEKACMTRKSASNNNIIMVQDTHFPPA